jgi:hypothetical protein
MKEANPIVSLIIGFDEQKQELKQFCWVHCQPTRSSQDSNFTKHRNVFSLSSSKASASIQGQKVIFVSKSIFKEESKKKHLALEKIVRREEMTRIVSKKTKIDIENYVVIVS